MQVSFDTSASGKAPTPQRMKLNLRSFKTKSHSAGTSFPALLIIKEISSRVRCPATRLAATQQAQEFQELLRQRNVTTHLPDSSLGICDCVKRASGVRKALAASACERSVRSAAKATHYGFLCTEHLTQRHHLTCHS